MLYVPKKLAERLKYKGKQGIGYLLALRLTDSLFVTNMTKPVDRNSEKRAPDPYWKLAKFSQKGHEFTGLIYHVTSEKEIDAGDAFIGDILRMYKLNYYTLGLPDGPLFFRRFGDKAFAQRHKIIKPDRYFVNLSRKVKVQLSKLKIQSYSL